jgi:pyruvate,water dikinase
MKKSYVKWFNDLSARDVALVGGKNASLGEMSRSLMHAGIRVPPGFAITADCYWRFLEKNDLQERIAHQIASLAQGAELSAVGSAVRRLILEAEIPEDVVAAITAAYRELGERIGRPDPSVAVRSSATAEDLPEASFAGQQESFLNVTGAESVLEACRRCFGSLFTDRAISYREDQGFDHGSVALSVGVQQMVRSDLACAGVMFSIDTETGFPATVVIDGAWGLGEGVVSGQVSPDEYVVFKPLLKEGSNRPILSKTRGAKRQKIVYAAEGDETSGRTRIVDTSEAERTSYVLSDEEILSLAKWAVLIEQHYGRPMDMEWAKDGQTSELAIVQARPETVQARKESTQPRTYRHTGSGREPLPDDTRAGGVHAQFR